MLNGVMGGAFGELQRNVEERQGVPAVHRRRLQRDLRVRLRRQHGQRHDLRPAMAPTAPDPSPGVLKPTRTGYVVTVTLTGSDGNVTGESRKAMMLGQDEDADPVVASSWKRPSCGADVPEGVYTLSSGRNLAVGRARRSHYDPRCSAPLADAAFNGPPVQALVIPFMQTSIVGVVANDRQGNNAAGDVNEHRAGVMVELMSGSSVAATAATTAAGQYSFTGVKEGDYSVRGVNGDGYIVLGTGATITTAVGNLAGGTENTTYPNWNHTDHAVASNGPEDLVILRTNATLTGTVTSFASNVGVEVRLRFCAGAFDDANNTCATLGENTPTTTDADGKYGFSGLREGWYQVSVATPAGTTGVTYGTTPADNDGWQLLGIPLPGTPDFYREVGATVAIAIAGS